MYRGRLIPGDDVGVPYRPDSSHSSPSADKQLSSAHRAKRIACLLVTDLPIAAITRANPELRERPFALLRMPTAKSPVTSSKVAGKPATYQPHSELSHVSPIARSAGLRPAMTVAQAHALIPDLIIIRPSPAAERAAADALLDVAESMSPIMEEGAPGSVWLDLTGVERLYRYSTGAAGSADEVENSIAEEIIRRAWRIGLEAAAGIGSNKEIAHLAARCGGARIIPAGMEREFLDWLPLDLLELDPNGHGDELELTLKRLGIRRLGDIARLDSRAIGSRLGRNGVRLAQLARGEGSATVIARPRVETFVEAAEFEYGIENLEPLGFVLNAMLAQLTARLQLRGLAAGNLTLSLGLVDRGHDNRNIAVSAATTEARSLLTLLKLHLEKSPPPAAVETVRLAVEPRARRPAQNDLFMPAAPAPDKLEAAIARIVALCGPERVGTLVAGDSYRPEAMRLGKFAPSFSLSAKQPAVSPKAISPTETPEQRSIHDSLTSVSDSTPIVLRAIRPAEEIEVMCMRNSPEFVRGNNICARVVSLAGPWRRQGEWWATVQPTEDSAGGDMANDSPSAYSRDYYEVALTDGAVYRIYCDLSNGKWFADGIYD